MWHRDMKWAHAVGKMVPTNRLALCKVVTNLQFVKNEISIKQNKIYYSKRGYDYLKALKTHYA